MKGVKINKIICIYMFDKKIYHIQDFAFNIFIIISWLLYISFAVGIFIQAPQYLNTLDYYVKIYISLFLLYRFNPFRKIKFNELDRKIVFSSGIFLFTSSALNEYLKKYLEKITKQLEVSVKTK